MPQIAQDITKEGSWIAEIYPLNAQKHAIIVDKITNGKVYIRDPWPIEDFDKGINGVEAVVSLDDFIYSWIKGGATRYLIKN